MKTRRDGGGPLGGQWHAYWDDVEWEWVCPCELNETGPPCRAGDPKAGHQGVEKEGVNEGWGKREGRRGGANKAQVLGVGKRRHRTTGLPMINPAKWEV
jgi:hypothetical protein